MKPNHHGYATVLICILLPVLFIGLGLVTFSLVKTRYNTQIKSTCQIQFQGYFSKLRSQIQFIESWNSLAVSLYQMQTAMLPFIWLPPVFKMYRSLLKIRQRFEKIQNTLIHAFNTTNKLKSVLVFAHVQRSLFSQNRKLTKVLPHQSQMTFQVNPNLQIVKKMNITFPPYQAHRDIHARQEFLISVNSVIRPQGWMNFFSVSRLNENYTCSASLKQNLQNQLTITYAI
ncbi:MAG: hypothetical protein JNL11_14090 [Bdellovibrionaceae bacterium]|nr:hypothetical protein [Pseudobdellovibrionaceae bacterium]